MDDRQKVEEVVAAAGAESTIEGFSDGYGTVLDPVSLGYVSYAGQGHKELTTMQESLQKPADVSGVLSPCFVVSFFGMLTRVR